MSNSQRLMQAITDRNHFGVEKALSGSKKVFGYHDKALAKAIALNNVDASIALIKFGADVEVLDERYHQTTAAMMLARIGSLEGIRLLYEKGADLNRFVSNSDCALKQAAKHGHADVARFLLEHGARQKDPVEDVFHLNSPILLAAEHGHAEVIKVLCEFGADANDGSDRLGDTPLCYAALGNKAEAAQCLIDHGADVNLPSGHDRERFTPLGRAAFDGHAETAALLIENGADYQLKDSEGKTASDRAIQGKKPALAEMINSLGEQKKLNAMIGENIGIKSDLLAF